MVVGLVTVLAPEAAKEHGHVMQLLVTYTDWLHSPLEECIHNCPCRRNHMDYKRGGLPLFPRRETQPDRNVTESQ